MCAFARLAGRGEQRWTPIAAWEKKGGGWLAAAVTRSNGGRRRRQAGAQGARQGCEEQVL
eukprot:COSAG06_NODE_20085_length_809_cov_1.492958_1_plen_59_part_01